MFGRRVRFASRCEEARLPLTVAFRWFLPRRAPSLRRRHHANHRHALGGAAGARRGARAIPPSVTIQTPHNNNKRTAANALSHLWVDAAISSCSSSRPGTRAAARQDAGASVERLKGGIERESARHSNPPALSAPVATPASARAPRPVRVGGYVVTSRAVEREGEAGGKGVLGVETQVRRMGSSSAPPAPRTHRWPVAALRSRASGRAMGVPVVVRVWLCVWGRRGQARRDGKECEARERRGVLDDDAERVVCRNTAVIF